MLSDETGFKPLREVGTDFLVQHAEVDCRLQEAKLAAAVM